ncbi:uncharacterized protein LOC117339906 [Pecten maximus]|uniref:uncharacterized protein LOC117339906 n=1 Tax=Pecten maximus TaxID=6579 RepID=UPI001458C088|nr:uncharacterized protein LOC117339906 [Pecten maximus]
MFKTVDMDTWEDESGYVEGLVGRMSRAHQLARENIKEAQVRQKRTYDLNLHTSKYSLGDAVFKLDTSKKIGQSPKLKSPWVGPYLVVKKLSPALYRICDRKSRATVVHHDRLKACHDRELPVWLLRLRSDLQLPLDVPQADGSEELGHPEDLDARAPAFPGDGEVLDSDPDSWESEDPLGEHE